jgi:hypothetical protein
MRAEAGRPGVEKIILGIGILHTVKKEYRVKN